MRAIALLSAALLSFSGTDGGAPSPGPRPRPVTDRYDGYFRKYSKHYFGVGFDWRIFKAQAMAESGLRPEAVSSAGARGVMQLMPSTFALIASARPAYVSIDDPQWNIAAGILHDRYLWTVWADKAVVDDQHRFMFGAYNAGEVTIARAQGVARREQLNPAAWPSVEVVAPRVRRWRYRETLRYVHEIDHNYARLRLPAGPVAP